MNIKQAKNLSPGDLVHYTGKQPCQKIVGPRGGVTVKIVQCRVTGMPRTWKTRPNDVRVPVKFGMYEYTHITHLDLEDWHFADDCPLLKDEDITHDDLQVELEAPRQLYQTGGKI